MTAESNIDQEKLARAVTMFLREAERLPSEPSLDDMLAAAMPSLIAACTRPPPIMTASEIVYGDVDRRPGSLIRDLGQTWSAGDSEVTSVLAKLNYSPFDGVRGDCRFFAKDSPDGWVYFVSRPVFNQSGLFWVDHMCRRGRPVVRPGDRRPEWMDALAAIPPNRSLICRR
jgi:hypothetical protein